MQTLEQIAEQIARNAEQSEPVIYGPWAGSMRSKTADKVPRTHIATGSEFVYVPRTGHFRRRLGQTQKFDTFGSAAGMLPAKWGGRARWMEEFSSESISDGIPTIASLVTKETMASASVLDDGRFSNFWVRDQVGSTNYTIGAEYGTETYPALGSHQSYKIVPLWYDSGDGGITRGTSEFLRRFFVSGSRRFRKVGNWTYHPSLYGTPSRWRNRFGIDASTTVESHPNGNVDTTGWLNFAGGAGLYTDIDDPSNALDGDTTCLRDGGGGGGSIVSKFGMQAITGTVSGTWTLKVSIKHAVGGYLTGPTISICSGPSGTTGDIVNHSVTAASVTTAYTTYSYSLTAAEVGKLSANKASFSLKITDGGSPRETFISAIWLSGPRDNNRLIPSGPIPPLHSGSLAAGAVTSTGGSIMVVPDADETAGGWTSTGASLFSVVDESTLDTSDYISCVSGGGLCRLRLSDPTYTPVVGDTVTISITARCSVAVGFAGNTILVELLEGTTVRYSGNVTTPYTGASVTTTLTLSAGQVGSVTDWTNLKLRLTVSAFAGTTAQVSRAVLNISHVTAESQGAWRGSDRFYHAVAPLFEDGSVWMPTIARPPSSSLPSGYNLFTVDAANPNTTYDRVTWSNLPKRLYGQIGLVLLRSPKISAVKDDNLQLSPFDMRVVTVIRDATTTTYEDYNGADDSLGLDVDKLFIRFDHLMPPRARYIFGGDMRVCHSYGGQNPSAIVIAPVGRSADYDLNLADDDATAYTSQGSWMQLKLDSSGVMTLTLIQGDGATATNTTTFASGTYDTLQKLVDAVNATNFATNGQQWRAQICPGANPDVLTTALCPHNREIASCVIDNTAKTITKTAGGLGKVAVGHLIAGATSGTTGAYVTAINSDFSLTYTGTLTTGTETLFYYNDLGDAQVTTPATSTLGFQRVICGALPGFLYFSKTQLDRETLDKQSVWMTTASPNSSKSAANNFSLKTSNRFAPPDGNAGISMGGGGVDNGFVVPYANGIYAIRNKRDLGTGLDSDYRIEHINRTRGCIAWNTVGTGPGFVHYLTREAMCAADLNGEVQLSDDIYLHNPQTGDFSYEAPLAESATARDIDYDLSDTTITAYASARALRGVLWVNYRASGASPNRQVAYDFSTGNPSTGLLALRDNQGLVDYLSEPPRLIRPAGSMWGWSTPLTRALTAMCEGRRSDGNHLYGWNDANAGSTGDGRVDEFETAETDNGTAISGSVGTPIERMGLRTKMAAQKIILEHSSPSGSAGTLEFHRGSADTTHSLTLTTSAVDLLREVCELPQEARASVDRFYLKYAQTSGSAREVRTMEASVVALRDSLD